MKRLAARILKRLRAGGRVPAPPPPLLSILILSIPARVERFLVPLLRSLEAQVGATGEVEVLTLIDNRRRTIGEKRNALLRMARGRFTAFVDDDDRVADDYVASILDAIRRQPDRDVICFDVWVHGYHELGYTPTEGMLCRYGIELEDRDLPEMFTRRPNHLMVFRSALARSVPFPSTSQGEDTRWAEAMAKRARKQGRIEKVLYHYDFDVEISETPASREWRRRRDQRAETTNRTEE
jgi:glycosyltransferase involved in cell wall biosynthesis